MSTPNTKYLKLLQDYDKHCLRIAQATSINIFETSAEKTFRMKRLEADYVTWFEYYFPNYAKKKCAWFHKELAKLLTENKRIRLLAEMYRSAGKSVHIDMGIPLFLYLAKKDLRFMLLIGQTSPKAAQLLSGIQAQLQHNNRIKNDYGIKFQAGNWADGDFTTTDGVRFMSLGFDQNPRGAREQADRPDYIAVDDVDDKRHVNSDRLMREAVDKITEDIWGCFDADDDATERFVYANNNFHKNSITNRLKLYFKTVIEGDEEEDEDDIDEEDEEEVTEGDDTLFTVLTVCAVKDLATFEPEWPDKTSAKYWRLKYKKTPYRSFMREYMHRHIEDGQIFKFEDILYAEPLPLEKYDALCFYGDLSYKAQGDYKSLFLVGKIGNEFHILMGYLRQKSRADIARWLYDTYEKHDLGKYKIKYWIEGLFAMDEFTNDFNAEGKKRGYVIPVKPDKSRKGDKFDRVESIAGFFEGHYVYFSNLYKDGKDFVALKDQFLAFEKGSGAHDDGPDSIHGAFSQLNIKTRKKKTQHRSGKRTNMKF
jgi:predicted phage terminase large subunit-like protein